MFSDRRINRTKPGMRKAPKVRYRPGTMLKDEKGQLWCCLQVYRLIENPTVWIYHLEERKTMWDPSTPMSDWCEKQSPGEDVSVIMTPLRSWLDALQKDNSYAHGDRTCLTAHEMRNFQVMSSGVLSKDNKAGVPQLVEGTGLDPVNRVGSSPTISIKKTDTERVLDWTS